MDIQAIKQRFGIIGHSNLLDRAIDIARQVAPTDITVLITGESGVGKEVFPQIIHNLSARKHGPYIAVNCGAIPEGTIDSELFGHEKGSFTGAHEARKGYFEVVNGGTIFLDEVAELPLSTQVRLLRVLETGEFFKVGSSKVIKTDARVVAATNVDIPDAIQKGKFRQDLFYRLNTVPIYMPPLRERKDDIVLLFRKFAIDFAEKYRMPALELDESGKQMLMNYRWQGNIRQLKNITEQISIIEQSRMITATILQRYLPNENRDLPVLYNKEHVTSDFSERELLYKVLFDMKRDINEMKKLVVDILEQGGISHDLNREHHPIISQLFNDVENPDPEEQTGYHGTPSEHIVLDSFYTHEVLDESLSLEKREIELIKRAIEKHGGKRKNAANELGISERTLYRKIKEYDIH
ncbi:MAG: sigma-54-dependent Fis family transcriptional regulator [Bacteroidetes bacterium HGW-Bacteroidetes-11]|jgi:transcriptional regulator with PAS, ATPase and Fis domain|nr:MAG: sigma-54-dependent Fis family transcriptional regulator [Bacteroidetes bacterium HGW-Bacteroidetes-11]